eukprot:TRINITY_DN9761_c0_g3_i2.p1 TRINITY_DN9761_c0_g3~~TRINITY_DN9761_c0_g3_i2.p1  ORF type:complete len:233 (+),score=48.12 TRINITY_DN9761_c0_g3_i2:466-1164(+)
MAELFKEGMYFSYTYDLTNTAKHFLTIPHAEPNKLYMWNRSIARELEEAGGKPRWTVAVIQGYVGVVEEELKGSSMRLVLISRRRTKKAGTRYNMRGIDDEGNVANMVETEQILLYNNSLTSFIQVRGSVPVFWKQSGMTAELELTRTVEMAFPAFCKHFQELVSVYRRVLVFNLLSAKKKQEVKLVKAFEANVSAYEKKEQGNVRYCSFDFHSKHAGGSVRLRDKGRLRTR